MSELPECTCDDSSDGHSLLCAAESAFEELEQQLAKQEGMVLVPLAQLRQWRMALLRKYGNLPRSSSTQGVISDMGAVILLAAKQQETEQ